MPRCGTFVIHIGDCGTERETGERYSVVESRTIDKASAVAEIGDRARAK